MTDKAEAAPAGFKGVTPHLVVRDAAAAIDLYCRAFGAEEAFRLPGPDGKRLMHAELRIGQGAVMLAEESPEMGAKSPQSLGGSPVTLHLYVADCDAVVERAAAAGCTVVMAPADMFWGDRYARLVDPFGHSWSLATHQRDVTPEEMRAGLQEALAAQQGSKQEDK